MVMVRVIGLNLVHGWLLTSFAWAPFWTRILSAYTPTWENAISTIVSIPRQ